MPENENTLVIMAGVKTQNIAKSIGRFGFNRSAIKKIIYRRQIMTNYIFHKSDMI